MLRIKFRVALCVSGHRNFTGVYALDLVIDWFFAFKQ